MECSSGWVVREQRGYALVPYGGALKNAPLSSADVGAAKQECSIRRLLPDHFITRVLEILLKLPHCLRAFPESDTTTHQ
jgi:hypothetical protein